MRQASRTVIPRARPLYKIVPRGPAGCCARLSIVIARRTAARPDWSYIEKPKPGQWLLTLSHPQNRATIVGLSECTRETSVRSNLKSTNTSSDGCLSNKSLIGTCFILFTTTFWMDMGPLSTAHKNTRVRTCALPIIDASRRHRDT